MGGHLGDRGCPPAGGSELAQPSESGEFRFGRVSRWGSGCPQPGPTGHSVCTTPSLTPHLILHRPIMSAQPTDRKYLEPFIQHPNSNLYTLNCIKNSFFTIISPVTGTHCQLSLLTENISNLSPKTPQYIYTTTTT